MSTRDRVDVFDRVPAQSWVRRMLGSGAVLPRWLILTATMLGLASSAGTVDRLTNAEFDALYSEPLAQPEGPMRVYHLGHSLVGRDMPAMLAQLAPPGHGYESQIGWGTTMKAHWEPGEVINGFEENEHTRFRDPREALSSGEYDALVITEMVEIRDAIRYFQSPDYLGRWAKAARQGNPQIRVFLYETWHQLDDAQGWLNRLDVDLDRYWEAEILRRTLAADDQDEAIFVIPAGQVMARVVRDIEAGNIPGLTSRQDLFSDQIHFNDIGAYLVALTHYAVLYQRSPAGLPHQLLRHDGSPADAPSLAAARRMQDLVWEVVAAMPRTGIAQAAVP